MKNFPPFLFLGILLLAACQPTTTDQQMNLLQKGVPKELADYRYGQLSDIHYGLSFAIPDSLTDSIPAKLSLSVNVKDLGQPLILDFKPDHQHAVTAFIGGEKIEVVQEQEHVVIPAEHLKIGQNTIDMDFIAGEQSLNRNADYLFTLLVPDRARTLFPCFDQPDLKATYKLEVTAPQDWEVLCGGALVEKKGEGAFNQWQFNTTDRMSTYLFSFVAGKFTVANSVDTRQKMTLLHTETDAEKVSLSTDAIFDLHQLSLDFMEDYTQCKFPFQKLDYATIFTHPYGGMEHVGAIQYRQASLFLDNSATQSQLLRRAKLIAHETSHMWYGDLVTMKWFDDVWLKEVFANFMADKIINPAFPDINHDLAFMTKHYPSAYSVDRTNGANPIRQDLKNLDNAGSLYGNIIYNKAPIMMRQLEALLGEEAFQQGMVEYIAKYRDGNAEWGDLIEILDAKTELDLAQWSEVWVNRPGRPVFDAAIAFDENGHIASLEISQQAEDGSGHLWPQAFDVSLVYGDSVHDLHVASTERKTNVAEAVGLPKPKAIIYNSNGFGYGVFPQDAATLASIPGIENEVARGHSYINAFENCLNGTLPFDQSFDLFVNGIKQEQNELILRLATSSARDIYWKYTPAEQRPERQAILEKALFDRLQQDEPANIKKTLFGLYESIAHSGVALERLYKIWSKELSIPNLNLNQDDYTDLAMSLAVYGHSDAERILSDAKAALTSGQKIERFEFLLPALSNDAQTREAFFTSFKDKKNREKEYWVYLACGYLHHPLRQQTAVKSLRLSLELLEEIKETGDIFFPLDWLESTIGQYTSKEAYAVLNEFIAARPDLDEKLLQKVLQAADAMRRVQGENTQ